VRFAAQRPKAGLGPEVAPFIATKPVRGSGEQVYNARMATSISLNSALNRRCPDKNRRRQMLGPIAGPTHRE
jgi:hypothetical protein